MEIVTLKKINKDIQEIKIVLNKVMYVLEEDFDLSEAAKKELKKARSEPISEYVDHEDVLNEFV